MQSLPEATKSSVIAECAREILEATPPVMWFVRRQMRGYRGALSMAQFRSLIRVNRPPNPSLSQVAEHLGASLPTTSRIVQGLVDKGLLMRHACRWDRRQVTLELTPRGREILQAARQSTLECMEKELIRISAQERSVVIRAMKVFKSLFGQQELSLPPSNNNRRSKRSASAA